MIWLLIALIIVALVILFYVVPFVLIIKWYNNRVRQQFITLCKELNLSEDKLTYYRHGAFLYPALRGELNKYQLTLISEPGEQFRFSAGKARATGRHVVTKLALKFANNSADVTIALKKRQDVSATAFTDYFIVEGLRSPKLSHAMESALISYASGNNKNGFPIHIGNGTIAINLRDMIWTKRKRETALNAIRLAENIARGMDSF